MFAGVLCLFISLHWVSQDGVHCCRFRVWTALATTRSDWHTTHCLNSYCCLVHVTVVSPAGPDVCQVLFTAMPVVSERKHSLSPAAYPNCYKQLERFTSAGSKVCCLCARVCTLVPTGNSGLARSCWTRRPKALELQSQNTTRSTSLASNVCKFCFAW